MTKSNKVAYTLVATIAFSAIASSLAGARRHGPILGVLFGAGALCMAVLGAVGGPLGSLLSSLGYTVVIVGSLEDGA